MTNSASRRKKHTTEPGAGSELELRIRAAEQALSRRAATEPPPLSIDGIQDLVHELTVHQVELELQNEELRRAQLSVDALRARYFDLYDLAPIGYVTLSERGLIEEANLRAASMLGVARGSLTRQPLAQFIVPEDQDVYYRQRKASLEGGEPGTCELRMRRLDGKELWVRLQVGAGGAAGSDGSTWVTLSDIHETRALQANLAQSDRMASMGVMAAGVAHEINNPLTYVLYNVESLAKDLPRLAEAAKRCADALRSQLGDTTFSMTAGPNAPLLEASSLADLNERATEAGTGVRRIKEIVKGLRDFSRVEQGELGPVYLNEVAENAIRMASNEVRCRAVLVKELGRVSPTLAPEGKVSQVLLNLIVNAAHSIKEGAVENNRITVRTWSNDSDVFAEVTDTGCGIPPEDQRRIFDPFFTTKARGHGTGLGLAIAHRIASELGGGINCESKLGAGSRFVVRLPIRRAPATLAPSIPAAVPGVRGRILVVDDEEPVLRTIRAILGSQHEVVTVGSGRAAMDRLAKDSGFDLILCDLMMPDVTGVELHAWLSRHHPKLAKRTAFITGGVFTARSNEYLAGVPNRQIEKPFHAEQLEKLVAGFLSDNAPEAEGEAAADT